MLPLRDLPEFPYDFQRLRASYLADEALIMTATFPEAGLSSHLTQQVSQLAAALIEQARHSTSPLFNDFLQNYHLDSHEGRVLLTLAEGLLRIPDRASRNELINSLLPQADWTEQQSHNSPKLVHWASKALTMARRFIQEEDFPDRWHQLLLKMGDSVLRPALSAGIHLMAKQFVMAETLPEALALRQSHYRYSFDCLGEAAQTYDEAEHYFRAYHQALELLAGQAHQQPLLARDSISIKLSALHPRFEARFWPELQKTLLPKLIKLVSYAAQAGLPITFDAEESERLELTLAIFAEVATQPQFVDYEGLGLAVQAYQKRAPAVIDWLQDFALILGHRIPVRLVKGAYWDSEIKRAQQQGLSDYPVFTRKLHTDICYLACAHKLLKHPQQFWPQFATHNAHTLAWLEVVAQDFGQDYEVQRLVGMGDNIHAAFYQQTLRQTRLYAPIGEFNTLLPYLVRRLLENGSSQSFVNQLANPQIDSQVLAQDPVVLLTQQQISSHPKLPKPPHLFLPRPNSAGVSMADLTSLNELREELLTFHPHTWRAGAYRLMNEHILADIRHSPVDKHRILGTVHAHSQADIQQAFDSANHAFASWQHEPVSSRTVCLRNMADQLGQHQAELLYLLMMEGGKTLADAVGEWREAVDLCHYYAQQAEQLQAPQILPAISGETNQLLLVARGVFVCISPWNFPLAIFLGQVVAALVTGNTVVAKAASQTPLIAQRTVQLLYSAGIPKEALQLIFGQSRDIGGALLTATALSGVVFTGSTATAVHINQTLAARPGAIIPFIAETGGLNAMIADSSALPEQLVQDVLTSAFNSAGQRCSALRTLWLQEELAPAVLKRLEGSLKTWSIGDASLLHSDMSTVIDHHSQNHLQHYCEHLKAVATWSAHAVLEPECIKGHYVAPHAFVINAEDLPAQEVFGPVLHIVLWQQNHLADVMSHINQSGYGLTLGIHSRISSHIDYVQRHARVGNVYINRNQIGAMVGCQPFGGEGLSGTGFKAGGPHYLLRFCTERVVTNNLSALGVNTQLLNLDS